MDIPILEPITESARKAYVKGRLSRLERILQEANNIAEHLPLVITEVFEGIADGLGPTNDHTRSVMVVAFIQMGQEARDEWQKLCTETVFALDSCGEEKLPSTIITLEDERVMEAIVILCQRLRTNSKRNILRFCQAVDDGSKAELKISSNPKEVDVRFRHMYDDE